MINWTFGAMKTPLFVAFLWVPEDFLDLRAIFPPSYKILNTFTTEIFLIKTIFPVWKNPFLSFHSCFVTHYITSLWKWSPKLSSTCVLWCFTKHTITNNELERIWKELVMVCFEVLYSSNYHEGLKQITKNPSLNSRCPNWDLDSEFPKHKSKVLMHDPTSFAGDMVVNALLCYEKQYNSETSWNTTFKCHSESDNASDSEYKWC